ncbi:MAG: serine/threonine protein kinase [Sandaracinaceae bacterium]|nr:serine/threonine protein kinase [Sandaracinaceae bacterium]
MPILTDQERIGTLLGERYRVDAILGRGGMGVVFRAHQEDDGHPVAVKILRPELHQQDPQFAKRFVREARAAAAVRHANVVEIRDVGEEADGTIFQVLELLVGETLREHLVRKGRLSVALTLELLLPVMHALEAAHTAGIVHRDLKPDNIFLARQPNGEAKPTLLDFGIAKLLDTRGGSFATNTGSIMGTPAYMAPEQAGGYKDQGPPIDIWAMGIIAYECLSGSPPFTGSSPAHVMLRIMTETPARLDHVLPEVPASIASVIERALARAPGERHAAMSVFREELRAAATKEGIEVPADGRPSTTRVLSLAPPSGEIDVAAPTDAAVSGHDTGEGVATMSKRLRDEREERERAREAARSAASANDSIAVTIDRPASSSRPIWIVGAVVATVVLGVGVGMALYGGATAPAETSSPVATSPPPTAPPPTIIATTTPSTAPPATILAPPDTAPAAPETAPPDTAPRTIRGPRGTRGTSTAMSTESAMAEAPLTTTMETSMVEATGTMMGGLPSVVGWEDE